MDINRICLRCMSELPQAGAACPRCGFQDASYRHPAGALPLRYILGGRYLIGAVQGNHAHSFEYSGLDIPQNRPVTIREYYNPDVMARRSDSLQIGYFPARKEDFYSEREHFREKSEALCASDPSYTCFKANHTWYLVRPADAPAHAGTPAQYITEDIIDRQKQGDRSSGRDTVQPVPGSGSGRAAGAAPVTPEQKKKKKKAPIILAIAAVIPVLVLVGVLLSHNVFSPGDSGSGSSHETHHETHKPTPSPEPDNRPTPSPEPAPSPAADNTGNTGNTGNTNNADTPEPTRKPTPAPAQSASDKSYNPGTTVMLYIIGSNLETQNSEATNDLAELMDAGIDTNVNNVLVCTGGAFFWHLDIPADSCCIYKLDGDSLERLEKGISDGNMSNPDTLAEFINYSVDRYPSEHYELILWDHGGGPVFGFGVDEHYPDDLLESEDIREAMDRTRFASEPLDLVAYNACIMNSIEIAELWSDYADYLLADAEVEYSWDYHSFEILNSTSDPVRVAERLAEDYCDIFDGENGPQYQPIAMTCLDLSGMDEIMQCFSSLADDLNGCLNGSSFARVAEARSGCFRYGYLNTASKANSYDLVDLGDLCGRLSDVCPRTAPALSDAIERYVTCRVSKIPEMMGMSVYFPYDMPEIYDNLTGKSGEMEKVTSCASWCRFVRDFGDLHLHGSGHASWDVRASMSKGLPELTLTQEQMNETAAVSLVILEDFRDGSYGTVLQNFPVKLTSDRKAKPDRIPDIFCLVNSDNKIGAPIPTVFMQSAGSIRYYCTESITAGGEIGALFNLTGDAIHASYVQNTDNDELEMLGYAADEEADNNILNTRNEVSLAGLDTISYSIRRIRPGKTGRGEMLPCQDWEETSAGEAQEMEINFFDLPEPKKLSVRDTGRHYVYQFVIEDIYGGMHGSELLK